MNIDALMTNINFANISSVPRANEVAKQEQAAPQAQAATAADSVSRQTAGGADFVAKIKGTNEAMGFISTVLKGLDSIASSDNPSEAAKDFNFNGKNMLETHTFDTTAGIVGVSIYLGSMDKDSPEFAQMIEKSKGELQDIKTKLSNPVAAMRAKQEDSLKAQMSNASSNPLMAKLGTLLDGIETSANRVGNQIF